MEIAEMTVLQIKDTTYAEELIKRRSTYELPSDRALEEYVKAIIEEVETEGDAALINLTKKFDGVDLTQKGIRVSKKEIKEAYEKVDGKEIRALKLLKKRIEKIERRKYKSMNYITKENSLEIANILQPIKSVGCYVPGGEAAYPSTLLMTTIPAKVAGVHRVVICSPPAFNGEINPLILVAASICQVDEVYRLGGVQAIAALAYGTESIRPVTKIVGPGNRFVLQAKIIVSKDVAIDFPAGPSEIIVLADESAEPRLIALDLISQSEHSSDNVAGLVTTSERLADEVVYEVENLIPGISRREIVLEALSNKGFILIFKSMPKALDFVNAFAPEHLEIITRKPRENAKKITSAGIILIGKYTPVSASDYCLGTNHVLPTNGFSRIYSELSVFDYVKRVSIVECSKEKLQDMKKLVETLANSEGLPNHYIALEERLKNA